MRRKKISQNLGQSKKKDSKSAKNPKGFESNLATFVRATDSPANTLSSPHFANMDITPKNRPKIKKSGMQKFRREMKLEEKPEADQTKKPKLKSPNSRITQPVSKSERDEKLAKVAEYFRL